MPNHPPKGLQERGEGLRQDREVCTCATMPHTDRCNVVLNAPTPAPQGPEGDVEAIRARLNAATPGPWFMADNSGLPNRAENGMSIVDYFVVIPGNPWNGGKFWVGAQRAGHSDATFIANARTDIATLLAALSAEKEAREIAERRNMLNPSATEYVAEVEAARDAALAERDSWKKYGEDCAHAMVNSPAHAETRREALDDRKRAMGVLNHDHVLGSDGVCHYCAYGLED